MNLQEEKLYIYKIMQQIIKERRILTEQSLVIAEERKKLTEMYFSLKQRFESLEELEMRGLENLSVKSFVDMKNDQDKTLALENLQREMDQLKKKIENTNTSHEEAAATSMIQPFEIAEAKFLDNANKVKTTKKEPDQVIIRRSKKRSREDNKFLKDMIIQEFKDNEGPFNSRMMYEKMLASQRFRDMDIPLKEFSSNVFYRITTENSDIIKKVSPGHFQYVND